MEEQESQFTQQNTNHVEEESSLNDEGNSWAQAQSQNQSNDQNYIQVNQPSQLSQNGSQEEPQSKFSKNNSPVHQQSQPENEQNNYGEKNLSNKKHNKQLDRLDSPEEGKLVSPLVGIIRRGSIGGTGEKGFTECVTPAFNKDIPFMGKKGGGKIPLVGEIRRGSISGIGERGFANSYVGKDEIPLKAMKYGSLGIHGKDKYRSKMKSKKNVAISGSKFGSCKNAYYMLTHNKSVSYTTKPPYVGAPKEESRVGYVYPKIFKPKSGMVGSSVRNNIGMQPTNLTERNSEGSNFKNNSMSGRGSGRAEETSDERRTVQENIENQDIAQEQRSNSESGEYK